MGIPGPTIRENEANASDPLGFSEGIEFLMSQGKMIALLPIEKWLEDLEHADVVGPFLDPTLYREYLRSGRDKMLKSVARVLPVDGKCGLGLRIAVQLEFHHQYPD